MGQVSKIFNITNMCSWEEAAILLKKEILYLDNRNIC